VNRRGGDGAAPRPARVRAGAPAARGPGAGNNQAPVGPPRPQSSGLNDKDLEQFREMLLEKHRQLVGDVGGLQDEALSKNRQDAAGDLSKQPIHMADIGSDNYAQELTLGLIEGERALLREIEDALDRIDRGTYGVCTATGQAIGKARLRATPWTKYCYEYMMEQEKRQRRGL
jgi:DnaK suppressor protein